MRVLTEYCSAYACMVRLGLTIAPSMQLTYGCDAMPRRFDLNMLSRGDAYADSETQSGNLSSPEWTQDKMFGWHAQPTQQKYLKAFGSTVVNMITAVSSKKDGYFVAGCLDHVTGMGVRGSGDPQACAAKYDGNGQCPSHVEVKICGVARSDLMADWFFSDRVGEQHRVMDSCFVAGAEVPCNPTCYSVPQFRNPDLDTATCARRRETPTSAPLGGSGETLRTQAPLRPLEEAPVTVVHSVLVATAARHPSVSASCVTLASLISLRALAPYARR